MQTLANTTQAYQDFTASQRRLGIVLPTVGVSIVLWMTHAPGRTLYLLAFTIPAAGWVVALCLWYVRNYRLRLYEDRLEVINLFGKVRRTILPRHVTAWAHPGSNGAEPHSFTRFILYTPAGNYSIRTAYYKDISLLTEAVQQGREEYIRPKQRYEQRRHIAVIVCMLIFLAIAVFSLTKGERFLAISGGIIIALYISLRIVTGQQQKKRQHLEDQRLREKAKMDSYIAKLPATFIADAHQATYYNESIIAASAVCGCFNCLETFAPADIAYWLDEEEGRERSAVCPNCESISVIGSATGYPVTNNMYLEVLRNHWFDIFSYTKGETFYADVYLSKATDACMYNKSVVMASDTCGCFYCLETYPPAEIQEWTNKQHWSEPSAVCPYCGTGTVIGAASGYPIADPAFLRALYNKWFD